MADEQDKQGPIKRKLKDEMQEAHGTKEKHTQTASDLSAETVQDQHDVESQPLANKIDSDEIDNSSQKSNGDAKQVSDHSTSDVLSVEEKKMKNEEMIRQLTAKNQDYIVKLNRHLAEHYGYSEDQRAEVNYRMLPEIIEGQRNHNPARKLYGPPTERAQYIVENPHQDQEHHTVERSEMWKLYLDGALLLGGIFSLVSGVSYFFGGNAGILPLLTLINNFVLGGLAVLLITRFLPQPGQKGGFLKYIGVTILAMAGWVLAMSLVNILIPPGSLLNPFVSGPMALLIGVVALLLKWYLKRKLNIRGTVI